MKPQRDQEVTPDMPRMPQAEQSATGLTVPAVLSTALAADLLLVEPATIRMWVKTGKLQGGPGPGRKVMISGESVVDMLRSHGITATVRDIGA